MEITVGPAEYLQKVECDLIQAYKELKTARGVIDYKLQASAQQFNQIYQKACSVAEICSLTVDHDADEYRTEIYEPFLAAVIEQLDLRFNEHTEKAFAGSAFIPKLMGSYTFEDALPLLQLYSVDLNASPEFEVEILRREYNSWGQFWKDVPGRSLPSNAVDALIQCQRALHPNIAVVLRNFAVLPVSTATPERSFSTLKILKTYLRNTTSEDRLNSEAMLYVYLDPEKVDKEEFIRRFSRATRRIKLISRQPNSSGADPSVASSSQSPGSLQNAEILEQESD